MAWRACDLSEDELLEAQIAQLRQAAYWLEVASGRRGPRSDLDRLWATELAERARARVREIEAELEARERIAA